MSNLNKRFQINEFSRKIKFEEEKAQSNKNSAIDRNGFLKCFNCLEYKTKKKVLLHLEA